MFAKLGGFLVQVEGFLGDYLWGFIESFGAESVYVANFELVDLLVGVEELCDFVDLLLLMDQALDEVALNLENLEHLEFFL